MSVANPRFSVVEYLMPQDALVDAGELRYKVYDRITQRLSSTTYKTPEAATRHLPLDARTYKPQESKES